MIRPDETADPSAAAPAAAPDGTAIPQQGARPAAGAASAATRTYTCPRPGCGWSGSFDPAFVAWCRQCNHGAVPSADAVTQAEAAAMLGRRGAARALRAAEASRARAEALYTELSSGADPRPAAGTRWAVAAFGLAVHLPFVLIVAGAAAWFAADPGNWVAWLGCVMAVGLAGAVRPRVGRGPRGRDWHRREQMPALFGILDTVAASVGAAPPDAVAFDTRVNAATGRAGLRQERFLVLGLPLWTVLREDERVALLAHEFAHQVNGDATHGVIGGSAQASLAEWEALLDPRAARAAGHHRSGDEIGFLMSFVQTYLLPVLLFPFYLFAKGMRRLHGRIWTATKPRAEYLADRLAARAASTDAAMRLLDVVVLAPRIDGFIDRQRARTTSRQGSASLWDDLQAYLAVLPEHERERLSLVDEQTGASVDATHPPTYLRRRLLAELPAQPGDVRVAPEQWTRAEAELDAVKREKARDLTVG
ncbi:M48 family metallopeptidase [Yinghuangia soli]|uniref:M48 family metallopeptidase n=1 Tax=Yinghuangia soli TaxID=2908204 RepID=A0AA41U2J2_9ACTN|nr:M48 family metallopeptidase [Yinghuangia soli]MCF2531838.1 M48 family metallopeptidase [Yinghuangia soli]